ncbi:Calcium-transporting ATPase 10, plasma membrane-type, partial [Kappamyces sp. JEL0680]
LARAAGRIASVSSVSKDALAFVAKSLNVNSTAGVIKDKKGELVMQGSKTEIAILEFLEKMGYPYGTDRANTEVTAVTPFSSDRKRMSCTIAAAVDPGLATAFGLPPRAENEKRRFVFVKGAAEIILQGCDRIMTQSGSIIPFEASERTRYQDHIARFADNALRTICCAIRPVADAAQPDEDMERLVLVGIFGILDPLRPEVPDAVQKCQKAGVVVRMVTGDSTATARAIARECGILTSDGIVMEGPEFRKLSEAELNRVLPKLQVLARSSPLDKQILVRNLKRLGETVAVTGDGTNDAPALAQSDVGFAM